MNRMDGKVCVITGATQGLGAAIARRLAAAGAKGIVVTGRNAERGALVARHIAEEHGIWAHFVQADFAQVEDCRKVILTPGDSHIALPELDDGVAVLAT